MKMDRWSTDRENINAFLRHHPIFHFLFTFCLGFTAWSLVDLKAGLATNDRANEKIYAYITQKK